MRIVKFLVAAIVSPLPAPALMYVMTYLLALVFGESLSYSLANYYQVGLIYAYLIFLVVGVPLFAVLVIRRVDRLLFFVLAGAAIYPLLIVGDTVIRPQNTTFSNPDVVFLVSVIFTGATLGAIFWAVALANYRKRNRI